MPLRLRSENHRLRTRLLVAGLVTLLGVAITLSVDRARDAAITRDRAEHITREVELLSTAIEDRIDAVDIRLSALAALFRASDRVDHDEYVTFASDLDVLDGTVGYGFAPLVAHRDMASWEAAGTESSGGFEVFGIDQQGTRTDARRTPYHAPITMFWPEKQFGSSSLGLDLASNPETAQALEDALISGGTVVTPLGFLPDDTDRVGLLAIHAVASPDSEEAIGFLVIPIDLSQFIGAAIPTPLVSHLAWSIVDPVGNSATSDQPGEGPMASADMAIGRSIWRLTVIHRLGSTPLTGTGENLVLAAGLSASILAGLVAMLIAAALSARRHKAELEAVIRAKDRFLASVSHELRTPLTGVIGFLDVVVEGPAFPRDERESMIRHAADQAHEMADIIDDLLTASRGNDEPMTIHTESLDLAPHVERLVHDLSLPIIVHGTDQSAWATADPIRVRQILRNLLSNAARHGRPPVEIAIERTGSDVLIRVSDHGDGVVAPDQLFRPYRPLGGSASQPDSLGLGLWISHSLAQRMNGRLEYHGDQLPTFTLTLPGADPTPLARQPETGPALAVA